MANYIDRVQGKFEHYFAAGATVLGLALSLYLPQAAQGLGAAVAASGMGYGASQVVTRRRLSEIEYSIDRDLDRERQEIQSKLDVKELKIAELTKELGDKVDELEAERQQFESEKGEIAKLQLDLAHMRLALTAAMERAQQERDDLKEELAKKDEEHRRVLRRIEARFKEAVAANAEEKAHELLADYRKEVKKSYQERSQRLLNQQGALRETLKTEIVELQNKIALMEEHCTIQIARQQEVGLTATSGIKETANLLEALANDMNQRLEAVVEEYELRQRITEIQHQEEISRLVDIIRQYNQRIRTNSLDPASIAAEKIAAWFEDEFQIVLDFHQAKTKGVVYEIWYKPRNVEKKDLKQFSERLWLEFWLADEPSFEIEYGRIKLTVVSAEIDSKDEDDKVTYKESGNTVKSSNGVEFEIVDLKSKMMEYYQHNKVYHTFVMGGSGSGKDTLIGNLLNLLNNVVGGMDVEVVDAKSPNDSPIVINGVEIAPSYENINYPSVDSSRHTDNDVTFGFRAMQEEVVDRQANARDLVKAGKGMPNYKYKIWFISEFQQCVATLGETVKEQALMVSRLGRSFNMGLFLNGQSGSVKSYQMLKTDLDNFTTFFLGIAAKQAVQFSLDLDREDKKALRAGINYMIKKAKGKPIGHPDRYWALVRLPNGDVFLSYLPGMNDEKFADPEHMGVNQLPASVEQTTSKTGTEITPFNFKPSIEDFYDSIDERKQEMSSKPQINAPRLSLPAETILRRYEELDLYGQSVNTKRTKTDLFTTADMRKLSKSDVCAAFRELQDAGYGVFSNDSWCFMGVNHDGETEAESGAEVLSEVGRHQLPR